MAEHDSMTWPAPDFSRVPYRVFADDEVYAKEQARVFRGPVWCYLALEAEIPKPGDFLTTFVGDSPIVVNRAGDRSLHAFANRCAHRGTQLVRERCGNRTSHTCIYHHWCYDLEGNLIGVPFQRGLKGKGGMPEDFDRADHGLQTLTVAAYRGVIFGSFDHAVEPLEAYLDEPMRGFLDGMFARPVEVIGYMRQNIPANWKLYFENLMDSYHAGLLHQFQTTFGIMRSTQAGGSIMDRHGRHRIVFNIDDSDEGDAEAEGRQDLRDLGIDNESLRLEDPTLVEWRDEEGDRRPIMMMALFPSVFFQRLTNTLATRQIRPKGSGAFELYWTYFGYVDDDPALRLMRIRQANLVGPAGLVSVEDGEAGAAIQRVIQGGSGRHSVIEMGGTGAIEDQENLITEVPVRGFWRYYCHLMEYRTKGKATWQPAT